MLGGASALINELDQVVNSRYPKELKTLFNVCVRCSDAEIAQSVLLRACQVDRLAVCLLEGLRQWPYVLHILARFAYQTPFRDALLRCDPNILHHLLVHATATNNVRSRHAAAAVAILSNAVPERYALPAECQVFFVRLVEAAAHEPTVHNMEPVYAVLKGTSSLLVALLPKHTLTLVESRLDDILRSAHNHGDRDAESHLLTLYCLAIMGTIMLAVDDQQALHSSFYETQDLLSGTPAGSAPWQAHGMRNFFSVSDKARRTVHLVVLQAMWACQTHQESAMDRLTVLRLANVILNFIPQDTKDAWCSNNGPIVQKLQQKALSCRSDNVLQTEAFGFICSLCKPVFLQTSCMESIRHTISSPDQLRGTTFSKGSALEHCLDAVMDGGTANLLVRNLVQILCSSNAITLVETGTTFSSILQWLSSLPTIMLSLVTIIDGPLRHTFQELACSVVSPHTLSGHAPDGLACASLWRSIRSQILHELSRLLLRCALSASETETIIQPQFGEMLLRIHAATASTEPCAHTVPSPSMCLPTCSVVEGVVAPNEEHTEWRQVLQSHLADGAQAQHDALSRLFAQACFDLEARCEDVERPLQDERRTRRELQHQYDHLQEAYNDLDAQSMSCKVQCEALEVEMAACSCQLAGANERVEELQQSVDHLGDSLRHARENAERTTINATSKKVASDLAHATVLAKCEADLEDTREACADAEGRLQKASVDVAHMQSRLENTEAERASLMDQLDRLQRGLEDKCAEVHALSAAADENTSQKISLEEKLHSANVALEREKEAHEDHVQQVKAHMRQNADAANAAHNEALDRMASQHGEEAADLQRRFADAEQQIKRLRRECKQKDEQITDADAMRSKLFAALGGPQHQASLPYRPRSTRVSGTQQSHLEGSPSMLVDSQSQAFDGRASFASNASSGKSRNGPTPKRAKPRKTIAVPSPAESRLSIATRAS
ncbi:hypothetical protein BAUCODRAFT_406230 [Baudoinia panamericana UAMH 10762]|uniref:Uncharacterized protein n=1 Tax=Baudoinia panamericana (strain UAMH 10762) TaxID=717646 RepID=M2NFT3_BAUPA|nr:uncharacterized protein BAUCODRAFT_406230 [Baudoinia panamericana UAMH 10762]EMC97860.1 hypothetical protein BAUCODRAFT_406230 [Baudoinia panamericana UAMH 10762]